MECSRVFLQKLCDEGEDVECASLFLQKLYDEEKDMECSSLFLQKLYDEEKDVEYASISEKKIFGAHFLILPNFNFAWILSLPVTYISEDQFPETAGEISGSDIDV